MTLTQYLAWKSQMEKDYGPITYTLPEVQS